MAKELEIKVEINIRKKNEKFERKIDKNRIIVEIIYIITVVLSLSLKILELLMRLGVIKN